MGSRKGPKILRISEQAGCMISRKLHSLRQKTNGLKSMRMDQDHRLAGVAGLQVLHRLNSGFRRTCNDNEENVPLPERNVFFVQRR